MSHVLSDKQPTKIDFQQTKLIEDFLRKENRYPPEEEDRKREDVLLHLHEVIYEWVKEVSMNQVSTRLLLMTTNDQRFTHCLEGIL